jgi:hypothetical protein
MEAEASTPGVKESTGKHKVRGSTGHGNPYLARVLGEAAVITGRTDTFPRRTVPAHRHIPGLLQTKECMREVFASARRPLEGQDMANTVAIRPRRQLRLAVEPLLSLHPIVDESALRRPVLPSAARDEQLARIVEVARLSNVTASGSGIDRRLPGSVRECDRGELSRCVLSDSGDAVVAGVIGR